MQAIRGNRIIVLGLGRFGGGIAVSRWLVEQGAARVLVSDADSAANLAESVERLRGLPIEFQFGPEQFPDEFRESDLIVASPAIPPSNPLLAAARSAGVPLTTEIRLFIERCPAPIIGVTGTKGKSTTTAMLGRMLETRFKTWVGGNIGKSLLESLPKIEPSHKVVLELSSFMLDYLGQARWSPHIAVVTMVASDHLDWHQSAENYVDAKKNIVRFQKPEDFAVLNEENRMAWSFSAVTTAHIVGFGLSGRKPFELQLGGAHNQLNAQAAFAAAKVLGVSWEQAQSAIGDFTGLPHRLQLVHERDGVRFVNDSIATIPQAAIAALNSFPANHVIQIVGGSNKKDPPIEEMCAALQAHAKAVICIGQTGPKIAARLNGEHLILRECRDISEAMKEAKTLATPGDVVLLSPGYASYDQFANFEKRGEMFTRLCKE